MRTITFIAAILLVSPGCQVPSENNSILQAPKEISRPKLSGTLSIEGAYALTPFISSCIDSFIRINPDANIELKSSGSGTALENLRSGKIDLALISVPRSGNEDESGIFIIGIAQDAVVPMMNKNNPFYQKVLEKGITPSQLKDIFSSGKTLTWPMLLEEEGNLQIKAYQREKTSGAAKIWADYLWSNVNDFEVEVSTGEDSMLTYLHENINSLGYANLNYAYYWKLKNKVTDICIIPIDKDMDRKIESHESKCLTIDDLHRAVWMGTYPRDLCRILSIAGKTENQTDLSRAFTSFLLEEGQQIAENENYCILNNIQLKNSKNRFHQLAD